VSDYQPRPPGGWPAQPPASGPGSFSQPGYGQRDGDGDGAYGPPPGRPPRRRRRHRGLIALLVVIVLILVILGVGDQIARSYAQNRVAQQIQTSAGMSAKPSVSIEGWPFLTQVASHDLKAVDIKADNVTTTGGKLPVSITAKATGVHVNSSFNGATVDHINGQVSITYKSLDTYLGTAIGLPGLTAISFSADPSAGPNVVKADFGIGSVNATVLKTGTNQLTIKFGSLGGIASLLGSAVSIPSQVIDIPKLPAGLVVGAPAVNSQGVVIPASASNTTLTQ
jgi:LmeA-like phospholipid-binding